MKLTETYTSLTQTHIKFDIYQPNVILRYKGIIQLYHGYVNIQTVIKNLRNI